MPTALLLAAGLGLFVPFVIWVRGGDVLGKRLWILFGLLPFLQPALPQLDFALLSWGADWPGLVSGIEVTAFDLLVLAIYFGLNKPRLPSFYSAVLALYFVAVLLSLLQAAAPTAAFFYFWQICRAGLLLVVVARVSSDPVILRYILTGLALGVVLEGFATAYQRFGLGTVQTSGTFGHQNTLGLVLHFAVLPQVALLLSGRRDWGTVLVPLAGIAAVVLTTSRAALLFAAIGMVLIYILSSLRRVSAHKILIGAAGFLILAAFSPLAVSSFEKRFEANPLNEEEYDERAAFERAATAILLDKPLGVGANHYVYIAKNFGYSDEAGVIANEGNRNNLVHNAYLLAASETGWPGLVGLFLLLAYPLVRAFRVGWPRRTGPEGDLLIGLGLGLLMVCLHSTLEYILLLRDSLYLLAVVIGMILGLAHTVERRARRPEPRPAPLPARREFLVPAE
ncbi:MULTISPECIES: O-antigen ligase family protein [Methylobacteriaceae]